MRVKGFSTTIAAIAILGLAGCATTKEPKQQSTAQTDASRQQEAEKQAASQQQQQKAPVESEYAGWSTEQSQGVEEISGDQFVEEEQQAGMAEQSQVMTDHSGIGQTQKRKGQAEVTTKQKVTRVETKTHELPTVESKSVKADINRMNEADFSAFGLSKDQAQKIVQYRNEHGGKFKSVNDLAQVPGIDSAWLQKYQSQLGASG